jgi:subtilisin family serine protease
MATIPSRETDGARFGSTISPHPAKPAYIVVFRRPSESNQSFLEKTLKVKAARGVAMRASVMQYEPRAQGRAAPKLYRRLGVALADLEKSEIEQILKHENVATVVRNRVRSIPKPISVVANVVGLGASDIRSAAAELPPDPLAAYLLGLRDAADAALRVTGRARASFVPQQELRAAPLSNTAWHLTAIDIASTNATGKNVKVAVLDTGIDLNHPDFRGIFTEGVNAASFVPGGGIQDAHGHGTHCAGLVAGPAQPASGPRYGVAPDVQLLIGRVLNSAGQGTDDQILEAIDWAADTGAKIISMSLGSPRYPGEEFATPYETVASTLLNSQPGILLIAAAGNESNRPSETAAVGNPAACPSIMSVAAVDENRQVAYFSCAAMDNIGLVDISGPGVAVYSSFLGGGYRLLSGTSMATPVVAGAAALHLEQNPTLRATALWKSLTDSASALGDPKDFGAGLVQAKAVPAQPSPILAPRRGRHHRAPSRSRGRTPAEPQPTKAMSI